MKVHKLILLIIGTWLIAANAIAKDYHVSAFGAKNDGITLNTNIIQAAIDYINQDGGGRLIFDSGVYVTGTIYLKSNVILYLMKGAELRSSGNPFDFQKDKRVGWTSMIFAVNQKNIGIMGAGSINGLGFETANNLVSYIHLGLVTDPLDLDRPYVENRPTNIYFEGCTNIKVTGITIRDPASWNQIYNQCEDLYVDSIHVDSRAYWNNDGIDVVDCDSVVIKNSSLDAADDVLCFKSFDPKKLCQNVIVNNCIVKSSANGLKFGSSGTGGFKNFKITNIRMYDTYRSAIALEEVDGGIIDNILIDSIEAYHVGNAIFLRLGDRWSNGRTPSFSNVTIENLYAEISPSTPDSGYRYQGPVEDLPRNISPSSIVGLPDWRIKNVKLSHIEIVYPGGGNPYYAKRGISKGDLESIPELPYAYPEFDMFKELPAWGFYVRHADNISFDHIILKAKEKDYRPAIVFDDAKGIEMKDIKISEPENGKKKEIILNNSTTIK